MTAGEHSPEFALVLACLRWPRGAAEREHIRTLASQPLRWHHLVTIAQHHKISPILARALEAVVSDRVPAETAWLLRKSNIENAHTCLRRITQLLHLLEKFHQHGVDVRVFKGIPLSMMAYHDPTRREAGDIDLLVAEKDVFTAGEVLRDEGYIRFQPQGRLTPRRLRSYFAHQKDFSYSHPTAGIVIDLHWRLYRNPWLPANAGIDQLPAHPLKLGEALLPTLAPPQLLLYLCVHGALDGWLRLKWLIDVPALIDSMTPEQLGMTTALAADQQALPQLSAALYLCYEVLASTVPQVLQEACLDRDEPRVAEILRFSLAAMTARDGCPVREEISGSQWFWHEYRQQDGWRYRLDLLARTLFRPRVWSWVQLPDWLFWLYPLLSPLEWLSFHRAQRKARPQRKPWRRPPGDLALAFEAACMLSFFRIALTVLPVQKLVAWMNRPGKDPEPPRERQARTLRRVQWSIAAVVRHAPLNFVCFPQCLAAYFMLRRRHIRSTLVYGVARDEDQLKAHTWVKVGDRTIVGGEAASTFTVLNTFP